MSERDELQANYDRLCKRIAAIDKDLSLELDGERQVVLNAHRAEVVRQRDAIGAQLALASWRPVGDSDTIETQHMMDARIASTETTIRGLDNKMDKLIDQVHDLDTRHRLLEAQVGDLKHQLGELKTQIGEVRSQVVLTRTLSDAQFPRTWLAAGGLCILLALTMLIMITWRVL